MQRKYQNIIILCALTAMQMGCNTELAVPPADPPDVSSDEETQPNQSVEGAADSTSTADDVNRAVETAYQAYLKHRDLPAPVREAWIAKAAEIMERDTAKFADVLVDEIGSPIAKAGFETRFAVSFLRAAIGVPRRIRGETIPSDTLGRFSMSLRQPVGVVAGITPFNVPLIKGIKQSAMALATGVRTQSLRGGGGFTDQPPSVVSGHINPTDHPF